MTAYFRSGKTTTAVLTTITILAALLLILAPTERTLGAGIKIVYLHVALIWTGMVGLLIAGLIGLALALTQRPSLLGWLQAVSWVGFGFFAVGTVVSLIAEIVNWGAVFWSEPRTASILQILAVAIIVQVAASWPLDKRLKGVLFAGLAGFMLWSTGRAELVLHPDNPIGTSSSWGIRGGFYGLFSLLAVGAAWLTLFLHSKLISRL
ncbi:MAG: hypothetical protein R3E31_31050 [Chloroflexota bacterium]